MSDLPETTVEDLEAMGVDHRDVGERLQRAFNWEEGVIVGTTDDHVKRADGSKHGFNLDHQKGGIWGHGLRPEKARNVLISDWTLECTEAEEITQDISADEIDNSKGKKQMTVTICDSGVAAGTQYALSAEWGINVNGNIPLGTSNGGLGITANMSQADVQRLSTSEVATKDVTRKITIPAGMILTMFKFKKAVAVTRVYKASIGVKGYVGISRCSGPCSRLEIWGGEADLVCPGAQKTNRVTCTTHSVEIILAHVLGRKSVLQTSDASGRTPIAYEVVDDSSTAPVDKIQTSCTSGRLRIADVVVDDSMAICGYLIQTLCTSGPTPIAHGVIVDVRGEKDNIRITEQSLLADTGFHPRDLNKILEITVSFDAQSAPIAPLGIHLPSASHADDTQTQHIILLNRLERRINRNIRLLENACSHSTPWQIAISMYSSGKAATITLRYKSSVLSERDVRAAASNAIVDMMWGCMVEIIVLAT